MNKLWPFVGRLAFWITWPTNWFYLRIGSRTRIIVTYQNRVLVVKSWLGNGKWGLPGGGRHRGESAVSAVQRELLEETGISLDQSAFNLIGDSVGSFNGLNYKYSLFMVNLDKLPELKPPVGEITAIQWLSRAELLANRPTSDLLAMLDRWS